MAMRDIRDPGENFNPRLAALAHAGAAEFASGQSENVAGVLGEMASVIACGLIYVGDQIAAVTERPTALQLVLPTTEAVTAWRAIDESVVDAEVAPVSVTVVACGSDVTLQTDDGKQHKLDVGDTLVLSDPEVT